MSEPYIKMVNKKFDDIESLENIKYRIDEKDNMDEIINSIVKEIKTTLYLAYKEKWKRGQLK